MQMQRIPRWYDTRQNLLELAEWLRSREQLSDREVWFLLEKPHRYQKDWEEFQRITGEANGVAYANETVLLAE